MKKCSMCGDTATHIATETGDYLCYTCAMENQNIKERDYPDKAIKHPLREL